MNNFIVPIDFSDASKNAARFAAHISNDLPDAQLILYNVFESLEYGIGQQPAGHRMEARTKPGSRSWNSAWRAYEQTSLPSRTLGFPSSRKKTTIFWIHWRLMS